MVNINWFVFGAVFLLAGLFAIYGMAGWAWLGFAAIYIFGLTSAGVMGAKAIVKREIT